MTKIMKTMTNTIPTCLLALMVLALSMATQAEQHEEKEATGRAVVATMEAVVTDINLETRQVTLKGPQGNNVTLTAREKVIKLEDVKVGDILVATYTAAIEGELRAPTEDELANPWVVVEEGGVSEEGAAPAIGAARVIRAVCTIEGMNRALGAVTIKDPNGKLHVIGGVEPEKMEGVTLGQTVVIVYAEALALTLKQKAGAAQ
ncbi:MAG: hypothetical protein DRR04_04925 [Gammaproteobacteria bacterium]|nr:MAG: hypothetical protein DRQ97_13160 [Gammaproteobacteria bacterium]RLA60742.1 MAG: hypothetical protein DRR04_04925 [Gammaproteobacteria bacterium]